MNVKVVNLCMDLIDNKLFHGKVSTAKDCYHRLSEWGEGLPLKSVVNRFIQVVEARLFEETIAQSLLINPMYVLWYLVSCSRYICK